MKVDQAGIDFLHEREGYRSKPYLDTVGIPTIGYGNTYYPNGKKVTMQDKPLTKEKANELFKITLKYFEDQVNDLVKTKLTQNQFNALVSFTYNVGVGNLKRSTVLKRINANPNDPTIKEAFLRFNKPPEIIGRREKEVKLYFTL
jgi:lysozyme